MLQNPVKKAENSVMLRRGSFVLQNNLSGIKKAPTKFQSINFMNLGAL